MAKHSNAKKQENIRDFGLKVLHKDHNKMEAQIHDLTKELVYHLNQTGNTKLAIKVKHSYKKYFQQNSFSHPPEPDAIAQMLGPTETIERIKNLHTKITNVFVDIDDHEIYTAVAKPFLTVLEETAKKIEMAKK